MNFDHNPRAGAALAHEYTNSSTGSGPSAKITTGAQVRFSLIADLREIGRDLVEYRELAHHLAVRDIKLKYKQAVMGFGWALFMPLFIVGAGVIIRLAMAQLSGGRVELEVIAGLAVKSLPWAFFIGAIGLATNSLTGNANLVGKVYFPREVLPLAVVLAQGVDLLVGTSVVLLILPLLGVSWSLQLLWIVPLAVLLVLFTSGVSLFLACANLFFRDVKYIVQVVLTFGIFLTPVLFEPAMLGQKGARLIMLNPMSPILEGLRLSVVEGHNLLLPLTTLNASGLSVVVWDPWYLTYAVGMSLLTVVASALIFHRSEFAFAENV